MKKALFFAILGLAVNASAVTGRVRCNIDGIEVNGQLNERVLNVRSVDGSRGADLNQNPITAAVSSDGKLKFYMSTVNSAGDDGQITVLYLPRNPVRGNNAASIAIATVMASGDTQNSYHRGSCSIQ